MQFTWFAPIFYISSPDSLSHSLTCYRKLKRQDEEEPLQRLQDGRASISVENVKKWWKEVPFAGDRHEDLYLPACPPICSTMVCCPARPWPQGVVGWRSNLISVGAKVTLKDQREMDVETEVEAEAEA